MNGAPRLTVHARNKMNKMVNTRQIQQRSIENGVLTRESNPRPLTCRESMLTFTPPGHLRNLFHYPTLNTQVNTMMYDLRCNAGGARPIKVRNE